MGLAGWKRALTAISVISQSSPSGLRTAFLASSFMRSLSSNVNRVTSNLAIIPGGLLGIENSLEGAKYLQFLRAMGYWDLEF